MTEEEDEPIDVDALRAHFRPWIEEAARSGWKDPADFDDELLEVMLETEGVEEDAPLLGELRAHAREAFAAQDAREKTWTARTPHDALEDALADLSARGIGSSFGASFIAHGGIDFGYGERPGGRAEVSLYREGLVTVTSRTLVELVPHRAYSDEESVAFAREVAFVLAHHGVPLADAGASTHASFPVEIAPFAWQRRRVTTAPASEEGSAPAEVPPPPPPPPKCALCGGRGWIAAKDASGFPTMCSCKRAT